MKSTNSFCLRTNGEGNFKVWQGNSTYMMAQTLLEVKVSLNEVLNIDSLLTSEWVQPEELVCKIWSVRRRHRLFSSASFQSVAFWLKAAEIARRNRCQCAYFCVLMLTLSRDSDMVTLCVVDRVFVGLLTDCWVVWVFNDLISSAYLS